MGSVDHCILKPSCVLRCKGVRIMSIYQECLKSSPRRLQQVYVCEECIGICIYCCIILYIYISDFHLICLNYLFMLSKILAKSKAIICHHTDASSSQSPDYGARDCKLIRINVHMKSLQVKSVVNILIIQP